jgi:hypothetical protein
MSQQESPEQPKTTSDQTVEPGQTNKGPTGEIKPPTRIDIEQPASEEDEPKAEGTGASAGGS